MMQKFRTFSAESPYVRESLPHVRENDKNLAFNNAKKARAGPQCHTCGRCAARAGDPSRTCGSSQKNRDAPFCVLGSLMLSKPAIYVV